MRVAPCRQLSGRLRADCHAVFDSMNACFQQARRLVRRATPLRLRAFLGDGAVRLGVPSAQPVARPCELRLTILGPLSSPSGIGEGARLAAEAFADLGFAVGLIDVTSLLQLPSGGPLLAERPSFTAGDIGGPLIVHLNPPHFQLALYRLGLSGRARPLIAVWAWELTELPRVWHRAFRIPHEVWVPSRFVAAALHASACKTPVRVVPHPVSTSSRLAPIEQLSRRPALRVLNCFAYNSSFDRKNPLASVAAFRRAFGARQDVELIVKTQGPRSEPVERALLTAVAGADNIRVMDGTIARADQQCLVRSADVTISLHRAEGFGLSLAEAMASGQPVIATAWSGNLDFMTAESACLVPADLVTTRAMDPVYNGVRSVWAEPSIDAAVAWLERLTNPVLRRRIGEAAHARALAALGLSRFKDAIAASGQIPAAG